MSGQVADVHHATEGRATRDAGLQVADEGLAGDEELVHEDVPGSDGEPAGRGEGPQPLLVLGTDLEVVVDDGHLAVEEEVAVGAVALELVEQAVDQRDQLQAEGLERLVPLAVPVGVGDDRDATPARCSSVRRPRQGRSRDELAVLGLVVLQLLHDALGVLGRLVGRPAHVIGVDGGAEVVEESVGLALGLRCVELRLAGLRWLRWPWRDRPPPEP